MEGVAKLFARTSVVYLAVSTIAGVFMFVQPGNPPEFTSAHSHLLLIGWVTQGLAAALMRGGKAPVALGWTAWLLTNIGLWGMVKVWLAAVLLAPDWIKMAQAVSGATEFVGLVLLAACVWIATRPQQEPA